MPKTILIVEDDVEVLRVYQVVLQDLAQVRAATGVADARALLQGVDLILLDYYLQGGSSDFAQTVTEFKPVAPVLVCSGVPAPHLRKEVEQHGLAGYWNKGSGFDSLRAKVQALLGQGQA